MSTGTARPRLRWELGLGLVAFGVYLIVDVMVVPGHEAAADRNGRALVDLEQWLHLDVERVLNQWLAPREVLATIANYEYAFTYVASALLLFGWVFIRRPAAYRRTRDSFLVLNILAIACFAWYPVTPPRLLPGLGLVDTVTQGGTWGSWGSPLVTQANQFAAMPSLHVAWALWVSVVLARLSGRRLVQAASALHVAVTVLVILATANHYLVDVLAAVPFVAVGVWVGDAWHGRRVPSVARVPSSDAAARRQPIE